MLKSILEDFALFEVCFTVHNSKKNTSLGYGIDVLYIVFFVFNHFILATDEISSSSTSF